MDQMPSVRRSSQYCLQYHLSSYLKRAVCVAWHLHIPRQYVMFMYEESEGLTFVVGLSV